MANVTPLRARPLKVEYRELGSLTPYAANARAHGPAQVDQIADSIKRFGFVNPVLLGEDGIIIAGHGRVLAARKLGMTEAPVIVLEGVDEKMRRALALADNRIALNSTWDMDVLRSEIEALTEAGDDPLGLGFSQDEIDGLFEEEDDIKVSAVATSTVTDKFWISIRGPLVDQAEALQRLQSAMATLTEVSVEMGTIAGE